MTPAQFARARGIIEAKPGRSNDWRKRAIKHLAADAHATPRYTTGKRVLSYELPNGRCVCIKHRYRTEAQALDAVAQIARETDGRTKPTRAYACFFCMGWHLTSEPK